MNELFSFVIKFAKVLGMKSKAPCGAFKPALSDHQSVLSRILVPSQYCFMSCPVFLGSINGRLSDVRLIVNGRQSAPAVRRECCRIRSGQAVERLLLSCYSALVLLKGGVPLCHPIRPCGATIWHGHATQGLRLHAAQELLMQPHDFAHLHRFPL